MPGVIMPVRITDERLIAEVEEMKDRGQAYVGTFLRKSEEAAAEDGGESGANWDPSDDMHDMGTFAQVQNIIRVPDVGDALKEGKEGEEGKERDPDEDTGGGATLLLLGHRRLRKTHTVRTDPMVVRVEHLKDSPRRTRTMTC